MTVEMGRGENIMTKRCFTVIFPYLCALNPYWVAAFFAVTALCGAVMKKQGRRHIPAVCFTLFYLCLVYTSTVLSRDVDSGRGWALKPFWSYAQWIQGDEVFLTYIVLNILMLLPIGVSLSFVWQDWKKIVLLGFCFSCLIEVSQLLTGRGLFEIDDILHNTLGVMLGILLFRLGKSITGIFAKSERL